MTSTRSSRLKIVALGMLGLVGIVGLIRLEGGNTDGAMRYTLRLAQGGNKSCLADAVRTTFSPESRVVSSASLIFVASPRCLSSRRATRGISFALNGTALEPTLEASMDPEDIAGSACNDEVRSDVLRAFSAYQIHCESAVGPWTAECETFVWGKGLVSCASLSAGASSSAHQ